MPSLLDDREEWTLGSATKVGVTVVVCAFALFQTLMLIPRAWTIYNEETVKWNNAAGVAETCKREQTRRYMHEFCVQNENYMGTWPLARTFLVISNHLSVTHFVLYTLMDTWLGWFVLIVLLWSVVAVSWTHLSDPEKLAQRALRRGRNLQQLVAPDWRYANSDSHHHLYSLPTVTEVH